MLGGCENIRFIHPESAGQGRGRYKSGWDSRIAVDGLIIHRRISFISFEVSLRFCE